MDDFQKEISKRVGACVTLPELQEVLTILDGKVSLLKLRPISTSSTRRYRVRSVNSSLQLHSKKRFLATISMRPYQRRRILLTWTI